MSNYMFANEDDQECSSGCESGWTSYLEHSSSSPYVSCYQVRDYDIDGRRRRRNNGGFTEAKRLKEEDDVVEEEEEEEDEDLSMVSDASSGPPHYGEKNGANGCSYKYSAAIDDVTSSRNNLNRKKNRENNRRRIKPGRQSSLLDDTASSPFFDFSDKSFSQPPAAEKVLDYSQGYSSTVQFEVRPPYQEQYDFFQSSPQYSGNHLHQNQWFEG